MLLSIVSPRKSGLEGFISNSRLSSEIAHALQNIKNINNSDFRKKKSEISRFFDKNLKKSGGTPNFFEKNLKNSGGTPNFKKKKSEKILGVLKGEKTAMYLLVK